MLSLDTQVLLISFLAVNYSTGAVQGRIPCSPGTGEAVTDFPRVSISEVSPSQALKYHPPHPRQMSGPDL